MNKNEKYDFIVKFIESSVKRAFMLTFKAAIKALWLLSWSFV